MPVAVETASPDLQLQDHHCHGNCGRALRLSVFYQHIALRSPDTEEREKESERESGMEGKSERLSGSLKLLIRPSTAALFERKRFDSATSSHRIRL
ncbi:hypothetical protein JZ751_011232 [Albula glossodonta]|uniref:Uncharacterized protein n=1 Tax=Albula glossodonta TaxID=121402 RepID=A0A8T2NZJ8_9TELE|nr:hypothetical protein JZ751_011232 [Albula glossodonta]